MKKLVYILPLMVFIACGEKRSEQSVEDEFKGKIMREMESTIQAEKDKADSIAIVQKEKQGAKSVE